MCLTVNRNIHPGRKRRVATRPLVVFKDLAWRHDGWKSPFYGYNKNGTWSEGVLKKETLTKGGPLLSNNSPYISIGLHSALPDRRRKLNCPRLWAVIPKGAKFFVGKNKDIVSNKLIVFKTKEQMLSYLGVRSLADPIKATHANKYSVLEQ